MIDGTFKRNACGALLAIGLLLAPGPSVAEEPIPDKEVSEEIDEAAKAAIEAAQHLIAALQMFVERLPQYAAPEVLENGDILIRRLPDEDEAQE